MNRKLKLFLTAIASFSFLLGGCTTTNPGPETEQSEHDDSLLDFKNLVFEDASYDYDGKSHSIKVKNAPSDATIKYTNNNKTKAGVYTVQAKVSKKGYNTANLTATMTINKVDMKNVKFENESVYYDGEPHSLKVTGAPSDATVEYAGNDKTEVGVYEVSATVSSNNYNTITLEATLTILKSKEFSGITFNDNTFEYDGYSHSIYVTGKPSGATVTYTNNGKVDVGTYTVTAEVTQTGYVPLTLTATMKITGATLEGVKFESGIFEYDGKPHSLEVSDLPKGATVTYSSQNKVQVGTYPVTATVKKTGCENLILKATLTIVNVPASPIGVDPNKTAYTLNESTTFDDLVENIYNGNFSLRVEIGDRWYDYVDDPEKATFKRESMSSVINYAVSDGQAYYARKSVNGENFYDEKEYTKIVGDKAITSRVYFGETLESNFRYISSKYFDETFAKNYPANVLKHLQRTDSNGFKQRFYYDYYEYRCNPYFEDGAFVADVYTFVAHSETKEVHHEVSKYYFYNIGNTKVEIPEIYTGKSENLNSYTAGDFINQGLHYFAYSDYYSVNLDISDGELLYLEKGHIKLLPEVDGVPIKQLGYDFYTIEWGDHDEMDLTGFILDVEFTEDFYYGVKYKEFGYVTATASYWSVSRILNKFEQMNGVINYHGIDVDDIGFFQDESVKNVNRLKHYNVVVIDVSKYTLAEIKEVQNTYTKVLGYLNIGAINKSASYYNDFASKTIADAVEYPNSRWIDPADSSWKSYVEETLIPNIMNMGVDGMYLDGTLVYDYLQSIEHGHYRDSRQAISDFIWAVDHYNEAITMTSGSFEVMYEICWDGNDGYAPFYVDYFIYDCLFTSILDRSTNTFGVQESEAVSFVQAELDSFTTKFKKLTIVLREYTTNESMVDTIDEFCQESGYHYMISDSVLFD